jgi:hypothetical protein
MGFIARPRTRALRDRALLGVLAYTFDKRVTKLSQAECLGSGLR